MDWPEIEGRRSFQAQRRKQTVAQTPTMVMPQVACDDDGWQ